MRANDLIEFVRRQPFVPFRLHVSENQPYEIQHADQIIVLRSRVVLAVGGDGPIRDNTEHIALSHIIRIEDISNANSELN